MKALVTGAAGFIGSHLVDRLLARGHRVIGVDNFSTGRREFLKDALKNKRFRLVQRDLLKPSALNGLLPRVEWVFHFAANADVRDGLSHPHKDLEQNTLVTFHVLEAMRTAGVRRLVFSSTGSVYGEAPVIPTPEDCPFPVQTSLYGASKLAAEGLISAYAEGFGFQALVFRFVSILGERYTHGHVYDFIRQLRQDPRHLRVLGNGKQRKSYLYIHDCINAIFTAMRRRWPNRIETINLGTAEYVDVNRSIAIICKALDVRPRLSYTGGQRGWVGDNPFIFLDCSKMRKAGWRPEKTIAEGVRLTARYLLSHPWILEAR
jgi:UDP-glucose 4-epimerase